jgi:hypothetical protein
MCSLLTPFMMFTSIADLLISKCSCSCKAQALLEGWRSTGWSEVPNALPAPAISSACPLSLELSACQSGARQLRALVQWTREG